jgi:hypothetical protein
MKVYFIYKLNYLNINLQCACFKNKRRDKNDAQRQQQQYFDDNDDDKQS